MQRAIPSDVPAGAAPGLRRTLRRASELSASDWATVLRASAWLVVARVGLRTLGFGRIDAVLAWGLPPATRAPDPARAVRLAALLDLAARRAVPPATCLPRSLALRRLLRRERLPAALRIGASRGAGGALSAHAWVTMDGVVIGDAPDIAERFTELVPGPEHLAALP